MSVQTAYKPTGDHLQHDEPPLDKTLKHFSGMASLKTILTRCISTSIPVQDLYWIKKLRFRTIVSQEFASTT